MPDEAALVQRLRQGDTQAYRELVDAYSPRVYRLALGMLGDPAEAEDVLQETFLSVYRNIGGFRGDSGLGTWIYRIAANASLMRLRRQRDAASLDETTEDGAEPKVAPSGGFWFWDPEEAALSGEVRQVMAEAIAALPEALRIVFLMRDVEDMPAAEVADALGLTVAAVKSRLHRARMFLRDRLYPYLVAGEETR
ncbi:MAG: sigma-70 family RNA polymerase sigma factor [Anaerolineae bacterium]|nr:sigma-70 family RNA polymerase sigma factor [Anaerolineae bacterium]